MYFSGILIKNCYKKWYTTNNKVQRAYLRVFTIGEVKEKLMPRDPVCGVILTEKTAKYKITHDGEKYFFCSVKCKKRFKRNRGKFSQ